MPDQSDPAANPPPPPKTPKLRESCDSCLIAKVKCSKSRPLCGRCLANGAPCVYSPSSRSGKRNRNSNGISKSINTSAAHTNGHGKGPDSPRSTLPPSASYLTRLMYPLLDAADRSLLDPNEGPIGGTTSPLLQESSHIPVPIVHEMNTNGDEDGFDSSDFLPTPPFHQGDFMDFMATSGPNPFPDFNTAPPSPCLNTDHFPASPAWTTKQDPYLRNFQSPLDMMPVGRASSSQTTPRPSAPPPPPPQDNNHRELIKANTERGQPCDCFAACLQVLQSLHNHSSLLSATQQGGPPFDIVLTINREAMESCSTMLECGSCVSKSGRSISTMMLATIFGKVMSLYRAACFLRFGPSTSMHATAQLAFGAYTVTGENRQLLEIEILLLELRKVESILAVYSQRFMNTQAEKDDETNVYNALTAYLDKNLRYIVEFLQMRKGGVSK
ncbi:hypothetical protein OEA41_010318 [Lepraria neglecta]|uniref:Zn(2)-C6 fungal-type domain-containing protein n=1 Tax=Lepraria neglecta TaxID=209136 RepID=A0AAD9YYU6_9LECA|nr:hypothetical protein OEA41_010318 [Lepraria neglecta]